MGQHFQIRARAVLLEVAQTDSVPGDGFLRRAHAGSVHGARGAAIQELSSSATEHRKTAGDRLDLRFVEAARRNWGRFAMADSTGRELTYGRLLAASLLAARWMRRQRPGEERIGILLPASVAGAVMNVGVTLAGRVPVNLNFTAGPEAIASAMEQCGIRTVVTSRAFLAKARAVPVGTAVRESMVFAEDILGRAGRWERLWALAAARLAPRPLLCRGGGTPDRMAPVVFSSGSTGVPKGVVLSHYNVLSNIEAIAQVFWIGAEDRIVGSLPFFHSFGYTVTIWFPLIAGCGVVYHPNPTDAQAVGQLAAKYRGRFLVSTPTICAGYTRKCAREDFTSLRYVSVGAEKLREPVAAAFREKFGVELLEGYGSTEMSPVIAVNVPDCKAGRDTQTGNKAGTVGHPLPGVAAKIVDAATFEPLAPNREGLLLVKGSNRMVGYLNRPDLTAGVMRDGWYITNDIALIDDEGFLKITDRVSRFSKIAGEMVPHIRIEEAIGRVFGDAACAVTAIADEQRGERVVALYAGCDLSPIELWRRLSEIDLPKLWIPKCEILYPVKEIPLLGTGKLDLRALKLRAQELATVKT